MNTLSVPAEVARIRFIRTSGSETCDRGDSDSDFDMTGAVEAGKNAFLGVSLPHFLASVQRVEDGLRRGANYSA